jgi:hypothetical protein
MKINSVAIMTPSGGQGKTMLSHIIHSFWPKQKLYSIDDAFDDKSKLGRFYPDTVEIGIADQSTEELERYMRKIGRMFKVSAEKDTLIDFGANTCQTFFEFLNSSMAGGKAENSAIFVVPFTNDFQALQSAIYVLRTLSLLQEKISFKVVVIFNEVFGKAKENHISLLASAIEDLGIDDLVEIAFMPYCDVEIWREIQSQNVNIADMTAGLIQARRDGRFNGDDMFEATEDAVRFFGWLNRVYLSLSETAIAKNKAP